MEYKNIKGYEGDYQADEEGNMYSLKYGKRRLLKPIKDTNGYLKVCLYKDGKGKMFLVHRLVAEAFLPNPENLPMINHKNEIKDDNRVSNLEFCDCKYNLEYNDGQKRRAEKRSKPVNQYTKEGLLIGSYPSTMEAQRQTGFKQGGISQCCRGERKQMYGYLWKWAE